nr:ORF3 [Torque teno felis virus]
MASFPHHLQHPDTTLVPRPLVKGRSMKQISGPATSTQTEYSKTQLIEELLDIIRELSDVKFQTMTPRESPNPFETSNDGSDTSSTSLESLGDWEIPKYPPMGGPPPQKGPPTTHPKIKAFASSKIKYTPF